MRKRGLTRRTVLKSIVGAAFAAASVAKSAEAFEELPAAGVARKVPGAEALARIQASVTRIHEAAKVPPLPPSEYRMLFGIIAGECRKQGPAELASAVYARTKRRFFKSEDVDYVLDALRDREAGLRGECSAALLADTYHGFVLDKLHKVGIELSEDEYNLLDIWFGASRPKAAAA